MLRSFDFSLSMYNIFYIFSENGGNFPEVLKSLTDYFSNSTGSSVTNSQSAVVKQPVHWFLGDKGLGIQQGTSVWVGSPKSSQSSSFIGNLEQICIFYPSYFEDFTSWNLHENLSPDAVI